MHWIVSQITACTLPRNVENLAARTTFSFVQIGLLRKKTVCGLPKFRNLGILYWTSI
jgi:hypothetical protein